MLSVARHDTVWDEYGRLRPEPVVRLRHLGLLNPATPVVAIITPPGAPSGSSRQMMFGSANRELPSLSEAAIPALLRVVGSSVTTRDQFMHPWGLADRQLATHTALLCSVCEEATRLVHRLADGQPLPDFLSVPEMDAQISVTAQRLQDEVDKLMGAGT